MWILLKYPNLYITSDVLNMLSFWYSYKCNLLIWYLFVINNSKRMFTKGNFSNKHYLFLNNFQILLIETFFQQLIPFIIVANWRINEMNSWKTFMLGPTGKPGAHQPSPPHTQAEISLYGRYFIVCCLKGEVSAL